VDVHFDFETKAKEALKGQSIKGSAKIQTMFLTK